MTSAARPRLRRRALTGGLAALGPSVPMSMTEGATPASRAALRAFMDRIDAGIDAGQLPIPTTQWLGKTTIAGAYIAGNCSTRCPSPTPGSGRCRPSRSRAGATESLPGSRHGVAGCVAEV